MNAEFFKRWLKRKKAAGVVLNFLFGVLALVAGLVVLFLTFWFTYAIIYGIFPGVSALSDLVFGRKLHLSHELRLVCSGVFIVLLFIQHARTSPWHWGDYSQSDYSTALSARYRFGAVGSLLMHPRTSANMIADILLSGPRLVFGAINLWRKSANMSRLETNGCTELLAFLMEQHKAVSYDELRAAGWADWLDHLRLIEGVLMLQKGITLSADLRSELAALSEA